MWYLATRKVLRRWTCDLGRITDVLLSPDGGTVLAAGGQQLIAYAAETGTTLWTRPFFGAVPAFSPDGQTMAILAAKTGLDLQVQLLDPGTGAVRATLQASADHPAKTALQFNQAGDQLACLGGDEAILWNPRTTQKIRALHFPGETVKRLNPRGDSVATSSGSRIRLWDTKTGRLLRSLNGARTPVADLAFSPDGRMLVSTHQSAGDVVTYVWPTRLGEETATMVPAATSGYRVLFNADGSRVYAAAAGEAGAWEPLNGQQTWKALRKGKGGIRDLAIHPADGTILFFEVSRGSFTRMSPAGELLEDFGRTGSMKFNRSGQLLLTVDYAHNPTDPGHGFKVQEYPSGKELRNVIFEKRGQPFAAFCLDDAVVATAALTGGITLWDWQAGKPLRQIDAAQTGSIACLATTPDGLHLATGGPDRWIRVWEAKTGRLEVAFRAHWEGVRCVKFSPDGHEILSGSEDGTVRIHDAATGEERLAFYGLTTPVADVDLSADGKLIAAISRDDGVAKVWDRQRSSAAALLPEGVITKEPVAMKDAPDPATAAAGALIAAGRTAEAIPLLEKASISKPGDVMLAVRLAALQAWLGMDAELAATRQRMLDWVPTTTDPESVRHIARVACLRPLADESQRQAALATARLAVEKGNNPVNAPKRQLVLGMAEYRSGHYLAADAALTAAVQAAPVNPEKVMIEGTANYYRVMSLFHQGKTDEARALFADTEAKVPRLPADEKNPLATVSGQEKLILWLACKEAQALLAAPNATPK